MFDIGEKIQEGIDYILYNIIYAVFYYLEVVLCRAIGWMQDLFNVFSGITPASYYGKDEYLVNIFFGNRIVSAIYLGMAAIGITLVFAFALISVIKKAFDLDDKVKQSYGQIFRSMLRSILIIVSMNAIMMVSLMFTDALMRSLEQVFNRAPVAAEGASHIDYTNEQFAAMSRILNTVGNYSLNPSYKNRYNLNACYNEIRTDLKYLGDTGVFDFHYKNTDDNGKKANNWQYSLQKIAQAADYTQEWPADVYNDSLSNALTECMEILKTDPNFHPLESYDRDTLYFDGTEVTLDTTLFLIGTMGMGDTAAARTDMYNKSPNMFDNVRGPYYNGEKSIYDLDTVNQDFDISFTKTNYLVVYFGAYVLIVNMALIIVNCIVRIFNLLFMYLIAPPIVATMPLDDGQKFKQWTTAFIVQLLSVFATIISMRVFLIYIPIIMDPELKLSDSAALNIIGKLIMIWAGAKGVEKANGILTGILTDNAGAQSLMAGDMSSALKNSAVGRMAAGARGWAEGKALKGAGKGAGAAWDVATLPTRPIVTPFKKLGGKLSQGYNAVRGGMDNLVPLAGKGLWGGAKFLGRGGWAATKASGRGIRSLWNMATGGNGGGLGGSGDGSGGGSSSLLGGGGDGGTGGPGGGSGGGSSSLRGGGGGGGTGGPGGGGGGTGGPGGGGGGGTGTQNQPPPIGRRTNNSTNNRPNVQNNALQQPHNANMMQGGGAPNQRNNGNAPVNDLPADQMMDPRQGPPAGSGSNAPMHNGNGTQPPNTMPPAGRGTNNTSRQLLGGQGHGQGTGQGMRQGNGQGMGQGTGGQGRGTGTNNADHGQYLNVPNDQRRQQQPRNWVEDLLTHDVDGEAPNADDANGTGNDDHNDNDDQQGPGAPMIPNRQNAPVPRRQGGAHSTTNTNSQTGAHLPPPMQMNGAGTNVQPRQQMNSAGTNVQPRQQNNGRPGGGAVPPVGTGVPPTQSQMQPPIGAPGGPISGSNGGHGQSVNIPGSQRQPQQQGWVDDLMQHSLDGTEYAMDMDDTQGIGDAPNVPGVRPGTGGAGMQSDSASPVMPNAQRRNAPRRQGGAPTTSNTAGQNSTFTAPQRQMDSGTNTNVQPRQQGQGRTNAIPTVPTAQSQSQQLIGGGQGGAIPANNANMSQPRDIGQSMGAPDGQYQAQPNWVEDAMLHSLDGTEYAEDNAPMQQADPQTGSGTQPGMRRQGNATMTHSSGRQNGGTGLGSYGTGAGSYDTMRPNAAPGMSQGSFAPQQQPPMQRNVMGPAGSANDQTSNMAQPIASQQGIAPAIGGAGHTGAVESGSAPQQGAVPPMMRQDVPPAIDRGTVDTFLRDDDADVLAGTNIPVPPIAPAGNIAPQIAQPIAPQGAPTVNAAPQVGSNGNAVPPIAPQGAPTVNAAPQGAQPTVQPLAPNANVAQPMAQPLASNANVVQPTVPPLVPPTGNALPPNIPPTGRAPQPDVDRRNAPGGQGNAPVQPTIQDLLNMIDQQYGGQGAPPRNQRK